MDDLVDNDGDGLINESALRIWIDVAPYDTSPGIEDSPVILAENLAGNGLAFTRNGAVLMVQLTMQTRGDPGHPPTLVTLTSGVNLRNE